MMGSSEHGSHGSGSYGKLKGMGTAIQAVNALSSPSNLIPLFKHGPTTSRGAAGDGSASYGEQIVRTQQKRVVTSRQRRRHGAELDLKLRHREMKNAHSTGGGQSKAFGLKALARMRAQADAQQLARQEAAFAQMALEEQVRKGEVEADAALRIAEGVGGAEGRLRIAPIPSMDRAAIYSRSGPRRRAGDGGGGSDDGRAGGGAWGDPSAATWGRTAFSDAFAPADPPLSPALRGGGMAPFSTPPPLRSESGLRDAAAADFANGPASCSPSLLRKRRPRRLSTLVANPLSAQMSPMPGPLSPPSRGLVSPGGQYEWAGWGTDASGAADLLLGDPPADSLPHGSPLRRQLEPPTGASSSYQPPASPPHHLIQPRKRGPVLGPREPSLASTATTSAQLPAYATNSNLVADGARLDALVAGVRGVDTPDYVALARGADAKSAGAGHWVWPDERFDDILMTGNASDGTLEARPRGEDVDGDASDLARGGHTAVLARGADSWCCKRLVVFGGVRLPDYYLNDVHVYEVDTQQWRHPLTKGPHPAPRQGHVAAMASTATMIVHGGVGAGERVYDDVFVLDLVSWAWSRVAIAGQERVPPPLPMVVQHENGASAADALAVPGSGGAAARQRIKDRQQQRAAKQARRGQRAGDRMATSAAAPEARYAHGGAVAGEVLFVFGGRGRRARFLDNELWVLHLGGLGISELAWRKVPGSGGLKPPPRYGHSLVPMPTVLRPHARHINGVGEADRREGDDEDAVFQTAGCSLVMVGGSQQRHAAVSTAELVTELKNGGSNVGQGAKAGPRAALLDVWLLDTVFLVWSRLEPEACAPFVPPPCVFGAATVAGRRLLVFGGLRAGSEVPLLGANSDGLSSFNLVYSRWQPPSDMLAKSLADGGGGGGGGSGSDPTGIREWLGTLLNVKPPSTATHDDWSFGQHAQAALRHGHTATSTGDGRVLVFGGFSALELGPALPRGQLCSLDLQSAAERANRIEREQCASAVLNKAEAEWAQAGESQRLWDLAHGIARAKAMIQKRKDRRLERMARHAMAREDAASLACESGVWLEPKEPDPPMPLLRFRHATSSTICVDWDATEPVDTGQDRRWRKQQQQRLDENLVYLLRMSRKSVEAYLSRMAHGMCSADLERDFDVVYVGPHPPNGVIIERLVSLPRVERFKKDMARAVAQMSRSVQAAKTTPKPKPPTETRFFSLQYYHPCRSQNRGGDWVGWFSPPTGFPNRTQIAHAAFLAGNADHQDSDALQLMMPEDDPTAMAGKAAERRASGISGEALGAPGAASGGTKSAFRYEHFAFSTNATADEDKCVDPSKLFEVGTQVDARQIGGRVWHTATIEAIHEPDGDDDDGQDGGGEITMDVRFTKTGVVVSGLPCDNVRLSRTAGSN